MGTLIMFKNQVVATKHGHHIRFNSGEATTVPDNCVSDCMAAGAMPEEAAAALKAQVAEQLKAEAKAEAKSK